MPGRPLRRRVERTLEAESFRLVVTGNTPDDESASEAVETDYVAPDRARSVGGGEQGETLHIDQQLFRPEPDTDRRWTVATVPGGRSAVENVFAPLRLLENPETVEDAGDELVVKLKGGGASARVRVEGGYVRRVQLNFGSGDEAGEATYEFSRFGDEFPPITAPPSDRVTEMSVPPPCDSVRSSPSDTLTICTPTGEQTGPREADLPAPTGSTESTLQFRLVRSGTARGCSARDANPAPTESAMLLGNGSACYDLEPAGLEVESANATAVEGQVGTVDVDVSLDSTDARSFDRFAEDAFGQQVAMVMFGQVLSAPEITSPGGFEGHVVISGLTPELASRVVAALRT